MAAATSSSDRLWKNGDIATATAKANSVHYKHTIVAVDATGFTVPGADTAGLKVIGISRDEYNNTGGANGAVQVEAHRNRAFLLTASAADETWMQQDAYVIDDQTVGLVGGVTNNIRCGKFIQIDSATEVWVDFDGTN